MNKKPNGVYLAVHKEYSDHKRLMEELNDGAQAMRGTKWGVTMEEAAETLRNFPPHGWLVEGYSIWKRVCGLCSSISDSWHH
jgi:hypothetical protein